MKLKTYRASTMADALAAVKKDLGKDAVILHTRQVRAGGLLGFGRKTLVEVTASDEPARPRRTTDSISARSGKGSDNAGDRRSRSPIDKPASRDVLGPLLAATYGNPSKRASDSAANGSVPKLSAAVSMHSLVEAKLAPSAPGAIHAVVADLAQSSPVQTPPFAAASPRTSSPLATEPAPQVMSVRQRRGEPTRADLEAAPDAAGLSRSDAPISPRLYRELADIKLLVNQVLQSSGSAGPGGSSGVGVVAGGPGAMPEALFKHYLLLLEAAVARDVADAIVGKVRDELNTQELSEELIVRTAVLRHLSALIPVADVAPARPARSGALGESRRPYVIALVGPTGVGKTTTLAKLAATYKLRQGRSVALITSDTYRIAAVEQLRTYAGIIGLPVRVVMTPGEMLSAMEALASFDIVLIDTAGRSQNATDRLTELAAILKAAEPDETHLVLSSTASEPVLLKTAESFACVKPNRVILTKLDEAVNFGVVVNVAQRLTTRLSFVTTGQEVPDQIEPGRPDRLARMILDNALVQSPIRASSAQATSATAATAIAERRELIGSQP